MDAIKLWDIIYQFFNVLIDLGGFLFRETYIPLFDIMVTPIYLLIGEGLVIYIGFTLAKYFIK